MEVNISFSDIHNGADVKTSLFLAKLESNFTQLELVNGPTFIVTTGIDRLPSPDEIIVPVLQTQTALQDKKVFILAEPGMVRAASLNAQGSMLCYVIDHENILVFGEEQNLLSIQGSNGYAQVELHPDEAILTFFDTGKPMPNAEIQEHMAQKTATLLPHMAFLQSRARIAFAPPLPPTLDGKGGSRLEP